MAAVNESIVREYFEMNGFLVNQPNKYSVPGRQKNVEEEADLFVINPTVVEHRLPEKMVWTTDDLRTVSKAVVGIRGWHTGRLYVSTLEQTPEILRFANSNSMKFASKILGNGPVARVLCLPRFPASGELKDKTIQMLKDNGVDGVIFFGMVLNELVEYVDTNKNYDKSDLLQILRLMKCYDLVKDDQMDFFIRSRRRH